ncbi:MAG: ATP-binding protein [Planctomycetaceae bacterium]
MIKSIRTRLQWWYSTIYVLSISVFGCLVYWRADRDVHERATLQAVATAQYLDVGLRSGPGPGMFGPPPNWMPGGPPFGGPPQGQMSGRPGGMFNGPGVGPGFDAGPNGPPFQGPGGERPAPTAGSLPDRRQRPPEDLVESADGKHQQDLWPRTNQGQSGPDRLPDGRPMPGNEGSLLPQVPPELLNQRTMAGNDGGRGFDRPPVDRLEYIIWRPDKTILAQYLEADSNLPKEPPAAPLTMAPDVSRGPNGLQVVKSGPFGTLIIVRRQMEHDMASLHRFGMQIGAIAAGTVVLGVVGGRWMSGHMVRPIQQISQTASQVTVTHLDRRIELRDLDTELVPLARVLNDTFQRLEHSFQKLNQFTADASHELRTPLAVIQSQVELALSQPRTAESYQQTLETCQRSAERMSSLVDGLLLLARSDSERLNLKLSPADLRLIAEDAVAQFHDRAVSLQIDLDCVTPDEEVLVSADPTFLGQVPMNLIQNALQHTPKNGKVTVHVTTDASSAILIVSDTGCGIAADHLPLLFDRFYRVDQARSRRDGGSGLGLAICRSLVEAHGGSISCESTPGTGSRFIVTLPRVSQVLLPAERRIS